MPRLLAVNSSPLILLGRISRLDLLPSVADEVVVPAAVLEELAVKGDRLAEAVRAQSGLRLVPNAEVPSAVASWRLGAGEQAVLAHCLDQAGFTAVLDDQRGRRCATAMGVVVIGTLGVVVAARKAGVVVKARPLLEEIRAAGYHIDDDLITVALAEVGEEWRP